MERRKFIETSAFMIPAVTLGPEMITAPARVDKGFVVKANGSRYNESTILFGGTSPNDIKVSSKDTDGQLSIFEYTGNVKGGPPLHIHLNEDEIFFIVEGEYTFKVDNEMHHLTKGDTLFIPRKVPHTFAQTSIYGKLYFMFQPSGKMEDHFRMLATLQGPPTPDQQDKLFSDFNMKVVGPPLGI